MRPGTSGVEDLAAEGDQGLDVRVAVLVQVGVEGLLVAHRVQARAGDHHRLGAAADLVARVGAEVLDHHLGLLGDVVGVQAHVAGERLGGLLLLDLGVVRDRLDEAVVGLVGGVVGEHVEDEALLDRLTRAVEVKGHRFAVGAGATDGDSGEQWRRGGDSNPRARLAGLTVFETAAFNRSATSPRGSSRVRSGAAGSAAPSGGREVAEREGFEPSRQVTPPTRFPVALLKPTRTPLRGARRRAP